MKYLTTISVVLAILLLCLGFGLQVQSMSSYAPPSQPVKKITHSVHRRTPRLASTGLGAAAPAAPESAKDRESLAPPSEDLAGDATVIPPIPMPDSAWLNDPADERVPPMD